MLRMSLMSLAAIAALSVPAGAHAADAPRYITGDRAPDRSSLPFSEGVMVGDTLYVAGHIGIDPKTGQAPKDTEAEVKLVMDGVAETVKSAGLTMDDVVSVTVYCTDLALYETFNNIYKTYFHGKYPTRAFIGVASILRSGHFEVQGIAVKTKH